MGASELLLIAAVVLVVLGAVVGLALLGLALFLKAGER